MKIDIPYVCVDIECNAPLHDVAARVSAALFPGYTWHRDTSGYYEEVPALAIERLVLGLRFCLVEQRGGQSYTLQSHFEGPSHTLEDTEWVEHDLSQAIALLLKSVAGFEVSFDT